jgi:hypothetical protein
VMRLRAVSFVSFGELFGISVVFRLTFLDENCIPLT